MIIINDTYEFDFEIKNPIPITKTNQDVKELGKRKGDYSNTITLPNNSDVREALGFNHDPAAWDYSGHTKSIKVKDIENGAILMDGIFTIAEADEFEIKFTIQSKQLDWKIKLANMQCSDIELGTFALTRSNVINTWTPGLDVVFPVIDWGYFAPINPASNVALNNQNIARAWKLYDCYPAFRVSYLIQKIFNSIGYTVDITNQLDNYYIFATSQINDADVLNYYKYLLVGGSPQSISGIETVIFDTSVYANTDYSTITGKYTLPKNLRMKFRSTLNLSRSASTSVQYANISIKRYSSTYGYFTLSDHNVYFQIGTLNTTISLETGFEDLESGDEIYVSIAASSAVGLTVTNSSSFSNEQYLGYAEDGVIDLTVFMPEWTQLELLQNIKTIFNLYFNTADRNVEVLTKNEYVKSTIVDLTDYVDRNEKPYIEFFNYSKIVEFNYSKDNNDAITPETIAKEIYDTGNAINSSNENINTGFAASFMDIAPHLGINQDIPKIYSEDLGNLLPYRNLGILPHIFYYEENYTSDVALYFEDSYEFEIPAFRFYNRNIDDGKSLLFNNEAGNGLRQKYYSEDLAIREDGRIFHCWVYYNEIQIANIDIRSIFKVDNTLFELKEIKQYQSGRSTEFELLPLQKSKVLPVQTIGGSIAYNPHLSRYSNNQFTNKLLNHIAENIYTQTVDDDNEIDPTYNLIRLDSSEGDIDKYIPIAYEGKILEFEKTDINNFATITAQTGFTIGGESSYRMSYKEKLRIKLVGTDWVILNSFGIEHKHTDITYVPDVDWADYEETISSSAELEDLDGTTATHIGLGNTISINTVTGLLVQLIRAATNHQVTGKGAPYYRISRDYGRSWEDWVSLQGTNLLTTVVTDFRPMNFGYIPVGFHQGRYVMIWRDVQATPVYYYSYSDDNCLTWRNQVITTPSLTSFAMAQNSGDVLHWYEDDELIIGFPYYYAYTDGGNTYSVCGMMISLDEGNTIDYDDRRIMTPHLVGAAAWPVEPSIIHIGQGRMIMVARDNYTTSHVGGMMQYDSDDYGMTWTYRGIITADTATISNSAHTYQPHVSWVNIDGVRLLYLAYTRRISMQQMYILGNPDDVYGSGGEANWLADTIREVFTYTDSTPDNYGNGSVFALFESRYRVYSGNDQTSSSVAPMIMRDCSVRPILYKEYSAAQTLNYLEDIWYVNASSDISMVVPDSTKLKRIKNIGSNQFTLSAVTGNIDGSSSIKVLPGEALMLHFDGTNWQIVGY